MKNLFLCTLVIFLLLSCGQDSKIPDVSHIEVPIKVYHFSQELFSMDSTNMLEDLRVLKEKYSAFYPLYFQQIIPILQDTTIDSLNALHVNVFIHDDSMKALYNSTEEVFGDFKKWEEQLHNLNKFMKFYFPDENTPSYYTFISEYSYAAFIFEDKEGKDAIGLGLDMYLGPTYNYRQKNPYSTSFSSYMVWKYTPDFLIKRSAEAWLSDKIAPPQENRLLDRLIYEGKRIYLTEKLIPTIQDTVLYEYRPSQLEWVKNNERDIWAHLLSEDLIYTRDNGKIVRLVNPAPSSSGMPPESPGQAALYAGYKIVDNFMKLHPEMELTHLAKMNDAQKILSGARYRP